MLRNFFIASQLKSIKLKFKATEQLRGDITTTERAPYPQAHEINIPRFRMVE